MLGVNLKKELESGVEGSFSETDLLVDDEWTGTWFARQSIDMCLTREHQLKKHKQFLQEAYSEKQVRQLCIKYRLRCLPVNLFKGVIDSQVPAKRIAFEREFSEALDEQVEVSNYRIVAPGELFEVAYGDLDPLLLYRFNHNGTTYYKFVHQWGGELNRWRSLINYPLRSVGHLSICTLLVCLPVILRISLNLTGITVYSMCILSGFFLTGALLCTLSFFKNRHGQYQTSDKIWDSQPVIE